MRLGGTGSSAKEGHVEGLGTNGKWGGICDDSFDINDAHVICRMLGFPSAIRVLSFSSAYSWYGIAPSGDNFVLDNLECIGNETSVFDCPHNGKGVHNCEGDEWAGVTCKTGGKYRMSIIDCVF